MLPSTSLSWIMHQVLVMWKARHPLPAVQGNDWYFDWKGQGKYQKWQNINNNSTYNRDKAHIQHTQIQTHNHLQVSFTWGKKEVLTFEGSGWPSTFGAEGQTSVSLWESLANSVQKGSLSSWHQNKVGVSMWVTHICCKQKTTKN